FQELYVFSNPGEDELQIHDDQLDLEPVLTDAVCWRCRSTRCATRSARDYAPNAAHAWQTTRTIVTARQSTPGGRSWANWLRARTAPNCKPNSLKPKNLKPSNLKPSNLKPKNLKPSSPAPMIRPGARRRSNRGRPKAQSLTQ